MNAVPMIRKPLSFTPKGRLKMRFPALFVDHVYIGCGPKGGGACIDCGYPAAIPRHVGNGDDLRFGNVS